MSRKLMTAEQDRYLRSVATGKSVQECTDVINKHFGTSFTVAQVKSYKKNHNIASGKKPWEFVDHNKRSIFTQEQRIYLEENLIGTGNKELTDMINKRFGTEYTVQQIKGYKSNHHMSSGITGCFEKGHIPANKGKKGLYSQGCEKTWFQKGHSPSNTDPIGTEKMLSDGYIWVKVDNKLKVPKKENWKQKHVLLWEKEHGPVPEGYCLLFLDGDKTHISLDNLELISRSVLVILNKKGLIRKNANITRSSVQVAKLIQAIGQCKRNDE